MGIKYYWEPVSIPKGKGDTVWYHLLTPKGISATAFWTGCSFHVSPTYSISFFKHSKWSFVLLALASRDTKQNSKCLNISYPIHLEEVIHTRQLGWGILFTAVSKDYFYSNPSNLCSLASISWHPGKHQVSPGPLDKQRKGEQLQGPLTKLEN